MDERRFKRAGLNLRTRGNLHRVHQGSRFVEGREGLTIVSTAGVVGVLTVKQIRAYLGRLENGGVLVSRTVQLEHGGTVTIEAQVNPFTLCAGDRQFIDEMIAMVEKYENERDLRSPSKAAERRSNTG